MPTQPGSTQTPHSSLAPEAQNPAATRFSLTIFFLVFMLIGLLGGLTWWATMDSEPAPTPTPLAERPSAAENDEPESTTAEAQAEMLRAVSPSDSMSAIEADLESTDLDALEAEMAAIEAELDAALESF